jgi:hypothetical protein
MSLIDQLKQREQRNRTELLTLLKMDEEKLNMSIFEGAYEYLEKVFGTDAYGLKHLPNTAEFWTWWRMEWAKIDSIFLLAIHERVPDMPIYAEVLYIIRDRDNERGTTLIKSIRQLREEYYHYHEASMQNRYINSSIMRGGAHNMITAIIKREKEVSHG